jgi:flagellar biosynthesis chaperone FliJ
LNNKEVTEVMENKFFDYLKSINAISAGDIKWKLYEQLAKVTTGEEYMNLYISNYDIYPTENYFLYEIYTDAYHLFKCTYSVDENDNVTVDYEGKQEVQYKLDIQPVTEPVATDDNMMIGMQNSLNSKVKELETAKNTISELEKSLNSAKETIKTLESEKDGVVEKFNGASDTVVSLNSKVEELTSKVSEMQPLIDKYNEEQFEKALNTAKEDYKSKFEKVGALEVFEQDETLELIKKSINSQKDIAKDAKFQLNQLIVDNVKAIKVEETDEVPTAKSVNSIVTGKSTKNLDKDFVNMYEEYCGFSVEDEK